MDFSHQVQARDAIIFSIPEYNCADLSGAIASQSLKPTLSFLDMPLMTQPEVYLANSIDAFTEDGLLANESTREFLITVAQSFSVHVRKNLS